MSNFHKISLYTVSLISSYFAPIYAILILPIIFIGIDFITGNIAYAKKRKKQNKRYVFKSKKTWDTVYKIIGSLIGITMAYALDKHLLESIDSTLLLTKGFCILICCTEFWSWLENIAYLSNSGVFKLLQKFIETKVESFTGIDIKEIDDKKQ